MKKIVIIGLGYVGLPLAIEFGKHFNVVGYDLDINKVKKCQNFSDPSMELSEEEMRSAKLVSFTADLEKIRDADFYIIAVPTPVKDNHVPDMSFLISATSIVGKSMSAGSIIIYESTVYPGATEEECIPVLEAVSGLCWKRDFFVGFSPERINPGDKLHRLTEVVKVVSGDTPSTTKVISNLYSVIVRPGVYECSSIKVAEASKVIENTQRDLNIALMNELAIIFDRLDISTNEVLAAAGTKWNFMKFMPGLVGGHCIGVDPYYLTHKAESVGYHPEVILSGRRINDGMGKFIAEKTIKEMIANNIRIEGALINIFGISFKENCSDIRNSKVIDVIRELKKYGVSVAIFDPLVDPNLVASEYSIEISSWAQLKKADALIVAVAHDFFVSLGLEAFEEILQPGGIVADIKSIFELNEIERCGYKGWQL